MTHGSAGNGHADSGHAEETQANGSSSQSLLAEAQEMRNALHDAYMKSTRLVTAVKRHTKRTRLVASTLSSLRQLQKIAE